jgi:hypothetical protein
MYWLHKQITFYENSLFISEYAKAKPTYIETRTCPALRTKQMELKEDCVSAVNFSQILKPNIMKSQVEWRWSMQPAQPEGNDNRPLKCYFL